MALMTCVQRGAEEGFWRLSGCENNAAVEGLSSSPACTKVLSGGCWLSGEGLPTSILWHWDSKTEAVGSQNAVCGGAGSILVFPALLHFAGLLSSERSARFHRSEAELQIK